MEKTNKVTRAAAASPLTSWKWCFTNRSVQGNGFLLCLTLFGNPVHAAAGVWATAIGGSGSDQIQSVAVDPRGPIVSAGYFQSSLNVGSTNLSSAGGEDIIVTKFTADGAPIWAKRFGGSGDDRANGVAVDAQGNVVVAGQFSGTVDFGSGPRSAAGSTDIFVAKLSGAGDLLWVRTYGGATIDSASSVAVDAQGKIFVTGSFQGTVDFGAGPMQSIARSDAATIHDTFLLALHRDGQLNWIRKANTLDSNRAMAVATTSDGDVVIAGSFAGGIGFVASGAVELPSAGLKDVFVARFSGATGQKIGIGKQGGPDIDEAFGLAINPATGHIAVTGSFRTSFSPGSNLNSKGGEDFFVSYMTPGGGLLWSKAAGSVDADRGLACSFDNLGNVLVAGSFTGTVDFGGATLTSSSPNLPDAFVARFTTVGAMSAIQRYGGVGADRGATLAKGAGGIAFLGGSFQGSVNFNSSNLTSASNSEDGFLLRTDFSSAPGTWVKSMGNSNSDSVMAVAVDPAGNIFTVGNFSGALNVEGYSLVASGFGDMLISKRSIDGRLSWAKGIGGPGFERPATAVCDKAGNLYVAGDFSDSVNFGGPEVFLSTNGSGGFLAKYSPSGNLLWSKTFAGVTAPSNNYPKSIALDPSESSVFLTGNFSGIVKFSAGVTKISSQLAPDSVLLKYSATDGELSWVKIFQNADYDTGVSVRVDASGNVFLLGLFRTVINLGLGQMISPFSVFGSDDMYLANLGKSVDAVSLPVWVKHITGEMSQTPVGMALDENGDVHVTGAFSLAQVDLGGGMLSALPSSRGGVFVAKYRGSSGQYSWGQLVSCTSEGIPAAISVDPTSGDAVILGNMRGGTCTFNPQATISAGSSQYHYAAKYNGTSGAPEWVRQYASGGIDTWFTDAVVDSSGFPLLGGKYTGNLTIGDTTLSNPGLTDAFIARTEP